MAKKFFDFDIPVTVSLDRCAFMILWIFNGLPSLAYDPVPGSNPLQVRVHGQIPVYVLYLDASFGLRLQLVMVDVDETVMIPGQHYRPGITVNGEVEWIHIVDILPLFDPSCIIFGGVAFTLEVRVSITVP